MEQRRLRLGDIVDDYCPRERRVTNHAVVAMIEEDIKQTRCTTCDTEHAYKAARVPARRRKEPVIAPAEAPYAVPTDHSPALARTPDLDESAVQEPQEDDELDVPFGTPMAGFVAQPETADEPPVADGPVHRRLIRATLPRPEGQKEARPLPDFTVRQTPGRSGQGNNGQFRQDRLRMRGGANGAGHGHGNRAPGGGPRFAAGNRAAGRQGARGGNAAFRNAGGGKRGRGPRG